MTTSIANPSSEDADELFTRGKIGIQVIRLLKQRNLKQREISELLGIPQPEVSHLMKGEFQRFSEGKLLSSTSSSLWIPLRMRWIMSLGLLGLVIVEEIFVLF